MATPVADACLRPFFTALRRPGQDRARGVCGDGSGEFGTFCGRPMRWESCGAGTGVPRQAAEAQVPGGCERRYRGTRVLSPTWRNVEKRSRALLKRLRTPLMRVLVQHVLRPDRECRQENHSRDRTGLRHPRTNCF